MTHVLDSNACIDLLRKGPMSPVATRLAAAPNGSVVLCAMTVAELRYGAHRSNNFDKVKLEVELFVMQFDSLPFDDLAAEHFGEIRVNLERIGMSIGPFDLIVASIARSRSLIVVTHNTSEFSRVPGLRIEDWQV